MTTNLDGLSDRLWLAYSEYVPTIATVHGEHRFDDRLPTYDDEWLGRISNEFTEIGMLAESLEPADLELQDRITRDLLIHETGVWANEISERFMVAAIDPYLGPHTRLLSDTQQNTVTNLDQAENLLSRYARVGDYLESALALIRENCAGGMTPPRASLDRVIGQLDGYLTSAPDTDPFLQLELPEGADRGSWTDRAQRLVEEVIKPAITSFRDGLASHVAPCPALPRDRVCCG